MDITFLAAGMGQRFTGRSVKHKCLVNILSKSLITRLVQNAYKVGIKNINLITGHNSQSIQKHLGKYKINFIKNDFYKSTNISHSIYLALLNSPINNDLIISYSDIYYKKDLLQVFLKKKYHNIMVPVLNNWQLVWRCRNESILQDAENLKTKDKIILSIGGKILNKKKVKYQYMGLIFIPKEKKKKIINFIKKKGASKLDATSLLNKLIKDKFIINYEPYDGMWYEFDKLKDEKNFPRYINNFKI
tara:strand:+ start:383 stop:1120 length:738 start_codon:yes stop_codon:yes gene_type:complete